MDQAKRDALISETAKWFSHDRPLPIVPKETEMKSKEDCVNGLKYMAAFNEDIFRSPVPHYAGGIALFTYLGRETLEKLVAEGYATVDDVQNNAPTLGEMLQFMRDHPGFTANGYAVEAKRDDCRVTITGLDFRGEYSQKVLVDFRIFSQNADERTIKPNMLESWWD